MKRTFGFTLIELLVVISIIGILVSILTLNFNDARALSRDRVRMSDLKSVQLALEVYKAQNGRYPEAGCGVTYPNTQAWAGPGPNSAPWGVDCDDYIIGLVPEYIASLPIDPNREEEDNVGYIYTTDSSGSSYKLMAYASVEALQISSYSDEFARCPSDCSALGNSDCTSSYVVPNAYAVYSSGAACW